jgi:hypothetical protein
MKKFCVTYNTTVHYDTTVRAKTAEEAKKKVLEVIGEDAIIEGAWWVHEEE